MSGTGIPPFLQGETRAEKQADEEWLIHFVVFLHQHMGRIAQGIKQRLSGIRYARIAAGYADPLAGRVRLWAALAGMHRWDGAPVRKVPVTPRMLSWLEGVPARVEPSRRRESCDVGPPLSWLVLHASGIGVPPWD